MTRHTILLAQFSAAPTSRTYFDFESIKAAVEHVIAMFEKRLKELNPSLPTISYDVSDLYAYLDTFADFSALVFDPTSSKYDPFPRDWLKQQIFEYLRRQAGK